MAEQVFLESVGPGVQKFTSKIKELKESQEQFLKELKQEEDRFNLTDLEARKLHDVVCCLMSL